MLKLNECMSYRNVNDGQVDYSCYLDFHFGILYSPSITFSFFPPTLKFRALPCFVLLSIFSLMEVVDALICIWKA